MALSYSNVVDVNSEKVATTHRLQENWGSILPRLSIGIAGNVPYSMAQYLGYSEARVLWN